MLSKDKEIGGLFVRHGKRGDTYIYARNRKGQMVRASLGSTSEHTLTDARRWAMNLSLDAEGAARDFTLSEVVERAVEKAKRKSNRKPDYLRYLVKQYSPELLPRPLGKITRIYINDRHDVIAERNGKAVAGRWVMALRTLFNFADKSLGWEGRNPATGVEVAPYRPRQVVWTDKQLQDFLAVCKADSELWHSFYTVVARTGMRRGNCCSMRWDEITGDTWIIPASKFKTKSAHTVFLSAEVQAVLAVRRAARKGDCPWVFPSSVNGDIPITNPYEKFVALRERAGLPSNLTIHDLRRTLGSRLAEKVPLQIVAKILGHKSIATTMRTYTVISEGAVREALNTVQT